MQEVRSCIETMRVMGVIVLIAGCASDQSRFSKKDSRQLVVMEALYTKAPIKLDGRLDEEVWKEAKTYELSLSKAEGKSGKLIKEGGLICLAWDHEYLYLGASFEDSDIVAEGKSDQLHHYRLGDVCELFLKPGDYTWYWELYATPNNKRTSFWFPSRGRHGLPSGFDYQCGLKIAATCSGTLNNYTDRDHGWTTEMAVPIRELTTRGEDFGLTANWRILVGRYNYSRYLDSKELSTAPRLSATDFHLIEEYASLSLVR